MCRKGRRWMWFLVIEIDFDNYILNAMPSAVKRYFIYAFQWRLWKVFNIFSNNCRHLSRCQYRDISFILYIYFFSREISRDIETYYYPKKFIFLFFKLYFFLFESLKQYLRNKIFFFGWKSSWESSRLTLVSI